MTNIKNMLLLSFFVLFTFIACSSKTQVQKEHKNSSVNIENDFINELALHDAIRAKDKSLVEELISKGISVNLKDKYGYTPMHLAARFDQLDIAKKLFAKGASVNSTDNFGDTPLLDSTRNSTNGMSRFLLCKGAKKDVKDRHSMTPLHNASKNNDLYIVKMLQTRDLSLLCENLAITIKYYDEEKNEICGEVASGVATNIDVTLTNDSEESIKPMGPFKSTIDGKNYCAKLDKPIEKETNYIVTSVGVNSIDVSTATVDLQKLRVKEQSTEYIAGLYESLMDEFKDDFQNWNAELDKNGLVFRFKDPQVLFESGSSDLKNKYKGILDDFFPRYLKVLEKYMKQISAVRVEGHTSSIYKAANNDEERYSKNKILSEKRARNVYEYTYNMFDDKVKTNKSWLDSVYSYHGMAYDDLIYDKNGVEDEVQSRRVEFRINKIVN